MPGVNGNEMLLMTPWGYTGGASLKVQGKRKAKEKRSNMYKKALNDDSQQAIEVWKHALQ